MRKANKEPVETGNELLEAIKLLEKEKNISRESLLDAITNSLLSACKNNYGTSDNVDVIMDRETCKYRVVQKKLVVDKMPENPTVEEKATMISLADAKYGDVSIYYDEALEDFILHADFKRGGDTVLTMISPTGEQTDYDLHIERDTYKMTKKAP